MINTALLEKNYNLLRNKQNCDSLTTLHDSYIQTLNEEEGTPGTVMADIANAENSVNDIILSYYMEREVPSIPRDVLNIVKMHGHTNIFFTIKAKSDDSGIEIVKQQLKTVDNPPKRTSITLEALHDIFSVHGLDGIKLVANFLRDHANRDENTDFINFLRTNAVERDPLTLSEPTNSEMTHFEVAKRVQEHIYEMNLKHQRTFEAFAIVPFHQGGAITGLNYINSFANFQNNKIDVAPIISTYRIAREILTDYYVNPDMNDNYVYVGLRSRLNPSCSCGMFGSYQETIKTAVAYETAEQKLFLFNRYGFVLNPAHSANDPFVIKFKITNWDSSTSINTGGSGNGEWTEPIPDDDIGGMFGG